MEEKAIVLSEKDNVATALRELNAGDILKLRVGEETKRIKLCADIPFGHKFCIADIKLGNFVIKYGETIGVATQDIISGEYVHIHNVSSTRGRGDLR